MAGELAGLRAYVDHYCERTGPGVWGEPLNALSNVGFFVAAWAIWRLGRGPQRSLMALCLAVGAGSTLFHLTAEVWSRTIDIGLIVLFELAFFWWYLRAGVRLSSGATAATLAVFAAGVAYSLQFQDLLSGSLQYGPALAAIAALGLFHWRRYGSAPELLAAAGMFAVALVFRTVDAPLCPAWPSGTHFVWHLLIAVVMALSVRALVAART